MENIELKPWNWQKVTGKDRLHWQTPAMEIFHFANILHREGKKKVYDIGCGLGRNFFYLLEQGFELYGSEYSIDAVNEVNNQLEQIKYANRIKHECMTELSEPDNHYDAIIAYNVIYHALRPDLEKIIAKLKSILKPEGLLFATFLAKGDKPITSKIIAPNTFVKEGGEEDGIPHHLITRDEIPLLIDGFELVQLWERIWEYDNFSKKGHHYCVIARKRL